MYKKPRTDKNLYFRKNVNTLSHIATDLIAFLS